jgi:galactosamine-6-phosphate isomerase
LSRTNHTKELGILWQADCYESLSQHAAELIVGEIRSQPDLLICAAAGSTPTRTYHILAEEIRTRPHFFDRIQIAKLDEWGGLDTNHEATCEAYLQRHLIRPLNISTKRYIAFRSDAEDAQAECKRIRALIKNHSSIDLCILGLGTNGHLGLNEPGESLQPFAHVAVLSESSLKHPMLKPVNGLVSWGFTFGMADILQSKKILLLVSGSQKREQLGRLLTPVISPQFPASFLWLHSNVTVLYDRNAGENQRSEE